MSTEAASEGAGSGMQLADTYVAACGDVMVAVNACLAVANPAAAARRQIADAQAGPQLRGTPIAIRNFTKMAEDLDAKFAPLFATFTRACDQARRCASDLHSAQTPQAPDDIIFFNYDDKTREELTVASGILLGTYGPTPTEFLRGVQATNDLLDGDEEFGFSWVYRPAAS